MHGQRWADLPFHKRIRDMLVDTGRAQPHHVLPHTGWVSKQIRSAEDVEAAIELFRLSYERAQVAQRVSSANRSAETLPPESTIPSDGPSSPAK
jgi:hypothetical protein